MYEDGSEVCNECGGLGSLSVPDVYFREPYKDPHLIDVTKPEQKDGVWIHSKRQKAQIMKKLKFVEAGDRDHGSRNECKNLQQRTRDQG